MAIVLLIKKTDDNITELTVTDKVVIGRSGTCTFKSDDVIMSSRHCSLEIDDQGKLHFTDLGSTNGSFLNNARVHKIALGIGDIIKIGSTCISIDEKKLTENERRSISTGEHVSPNESTKDLLNFKFFPRSMAVLEQEISSGFTKLLELTTIKTNKKQRSKVIRGL